MSGLLILCATEFELSVFLGRHSDGVKHTLKNGQTLYAAAGSPPAWACLVTGPGVFNTAMGLAAYLERQTPALILDTGIAGAYEPAGIGDVGIADEEQYLHTGVGNEPLALAALPFDLIPDIPGTRQGRYGFDPELVEACTEQLKAALPADLCRIVTGRFLTVSAITEGRQRAGDVHKRLSPVMEAMEGAAAAHVARCFDVPLIEVRAASNIAGERNKDNWDFKCAVGLVDRICRCFVR